jgi:hypothetical protein
MHQKTPEDTRRHETKAEDRQLLGGADRLHPSVARPPPHRDSSMPF